MSDKKVGRSYRRPITPTEKMESALSDPGTMNVADIPHDKGKSAMVDKFREREEGWRREQSLHDQAAAHAAEPAGRLAAEAGKPAEAGEAAEGRGGEEGGCS
jgi:hypothetical protein